ncbi:hypothetical protein HBI56_105130 [Parastagonospora nodorum]|uniref:BTB domain-containing protein n=2 Tax=Phaeosphaeria nodorum (strain SN15 / ATCC MYA-4574 / FGSC 10173) TaxID=321614 RepID=A0A7U2I5N6_PHANO|nr:hypothetical protein SNOG_11455 [Parastagonospora nodorum SN15]KAH3911353.1 hypothetical protein HBH56_133780 [Parastagonospora nodorum]EAT81163.2 hypothetical protein SNOG_11455 [Parastagonospora nodorum SN15]KAH3926928.1 hypothetical protein HBH54_159510 [Parastagonospora nodorum]KAH3949305.1 hypothetical protein HBH53_088850 [Parastagonospora nodorum]KAH3974855.1 hypothetical protein HBH52_132890 [Parastagonospora nodorum]
MSILSNCKGPPVAAPSTCFNHLDVMTITVREGVKSKEYHVFHGLLTWHSGYLAAALSPTSGFHDSGTNSFEFIEDIEVFDTFTCWLYTGKLDDASEPISAARPPHLSPLVLSKIWVFADFHIIPALGNAAIDALHEHQALLWVTPSPVIKYVYEHTKPDSLLRRYLQDAFTKTMTLESVMSRDKEEHTVEFLHDILLVIARRKKGEKLERMQWAKLDRCKWHDHSGPGGRLRMESRK